MTDGTVVTLSRFDRSVSRALERRGRALLSAPDLAARVAQLEPLEAYFVVKELGIEEALPILRHADSDLFRVFVDLDCWTGDQPDALEIDAWLAAFVSHDTAAVAQAFSKIDFELRVFFLAASLEIHDARDEALPAPRRGVDRMTTPDTFFVLDAPTADQRELHPFVLVNALYGMDMSEAFHLLLEARTELLSPLVERAYRFHCARLQELGFSAAEEAVAIFAPPPSEPPPSRLVVPVSTNLPALYAQHLRDDSLFARAMMGVIDSDLARAAESDLVYLVNAAVVAYGKSPQSVSHVAEIAERVRDTLSLGLETILRREDPTVTADSASAAERATPLLGKWPLRLVFRWGHHAVRPLATTARAMAEDPILRRWLDRPESVEDDYGPDRLDRELVRGLLLSRPLWAGWDPMQPAQRKAFSRHAELAEAEQRLERITERLG